MIRIDNFPDGLIDDLLIDEANVRIDRTGQARYRFTITSSNKTTEFDLWTTKKGRIAFKWGSGVRPACVDVVKKGNELVGDFLSVSQP